MQLNFSYDSSVSSAPTGFVSALNYVAGVLDALILNPITVNIDIGWNEIAGSAVGGGDLAEGGDSQGNYIPYAQLVADLITNAANPADLQELAALPANAATQLAGSLFVTTAQEKAWGLLAPNADTMDGAVGFSSAYTYDFDPANQAVPGEYGFIAIAEHEITHALGRIYGYGAFALTDYSAPGVLNTSGGGGYYSIDGGVTDLQNFSRASLDPADWAPQNGDSFDAQYDQGVAGAVTAVDQTLLATLGFAVANTQFLVADQTTGTSTMQNGTPTAVGSAQTQDFIMASADNIRIASAVPNSFIYVAGAGLDSVDVAAANGNNVICGFGASDFLVGGSGDDAFYLDDRTPTGGTWSSIVNFHAGDSLTVWGVTTADFALTWLNNQGTAGATGLTAQFVATGRPEVLVTLAGFSTADLNSGKLAVAFGTLPGQAGTPGSSFMTVTAT